MVRGRRGWAAARGSSAALRPSAGAETSSDPAQQRPQAEGRGTRIVGGPIEGSINERYVNPRLWLGLDAAFEGCVGVLLLSGQTGFLHDQLPLPTVALIVIGCVLLIAGAALALAAWARVAALLRPLAMGNAGLAVLVAAWWTIARQGFGAAGTGVIACVVVALVVLAVGEWLAGGHIGRCCWGFHIGPLSFISAD